MPSPIPPSITTPNKVESRIGPLFFKDGMPSKETLAKVYDNLDFTHAFEAFVNTMQGVNAQAICKGFLDIGVKDNEMLVFSKLMDAKSLFLTANADTVYFVGGLDLSKGPMVLETPPKALGTIDDAWWRWVIDFGAPGPDRGEGGKYLFLPPGYDGPVPEGGFYVSRVEDKPRAGPRANVHGEGRSAAGGGSDPQVHQDLSIRSRRRGHEHRGVPWRQHPARPRHSAAARPCSTKAAAR